jgi:hypothetical protein
MVTGQREALRMQLAAIAGDEPASSFIEIRWRRPQGGMGQCFHGCRCPDPLLEFIERFGQQTDVYVSATPRVGRRGTTDAIERVWCLWADCDSADAVARLRQFQPAAAVVVRSGTGSNCHAYWPLSDPLPPKFAKRANFRLVRALGADRACADVARVLRPASTLNHKHRPPRPIECVRLEPDTFTLAQVVAGLPDHPAAIPPRPAVVTPIVRSIGSIEGVTRVVREAPVGERNVRLYWAARRVGEWIAAGALSEFEAWSQLRAAAEEVGLPGHEAMRTIRSGIQTGAAA